MQRDPTVPGPTEPGSPDELPRKMNPSEHDALARLAVNRDAMADLEKRLSQWAAALNQRLRDNEPPDPIAS